MEPAIARGIGGRFTDEGKRMFFRTYKRVVKDVRLVSRTARWPG
jgi:hypothetical protein